MDERTETAIWEYISIGIQGKNKYVCINFFWGGNVLGGQVSLGGNWHLPFILKKNKWKFNIIRYEFQCMKRMKGYASDKSRILLADLSYMNRRKIKI